MTKSIRILVAGLTVATAATIGTTLTPHNSADTTWGAPATGDDTTWGNPPTTDDSDGNSEGEGTGQDTPVRPADTTWG